MDKHKANYINTYKSILVQLLPLSIFLFANCNTKLDLPSIPVDSQPAQQEIQRETIRLDKQEDTGLVQKGFANLPIELQAYILAFLDGKDFHRASLVCRSWRDAAFIVGDKKTLDLSGKKLDQKDCEALLQIPFSSLILQECRLGEQEAVVLSRSTRIKELNLGGNYIGNGSFTKELTNRILVAATFLNLYSNSIEGACAKMFASGNLMTLTSLNLSHNSINDEDAKALANGSLVALTSLDLGNNNINVYGAKALASGNLVTLTSLNLCNNWLSDAGTMWLANGNLTALTSLNLSNNCINVMSARALANGSLVALTSLDLSNNWLGNAGTTWLDNGNLTALTSLNLENNKTPQIKKRLDQELDF